MWIHFQPLEYPIYLANCMQFLHTYILSEWTGKIWTVASVCALATYILPQTFAA